jgi:hypothetical protein
MAAARARGLAEPTAKPRFDAYAGMLLLSLLAMVGGTVLLFLDYNEYPAGKPTLPPPPGKAAPAAAPSGPAAAPPAPGNPGGNPAPPPGGPGVPAPAPGGAGGAGKAPGT